MQDVLEFAKTNLCILRWPEAAIAKDNREWAYVAIGNCWRYLCVFFLLHVYMKQWKVCLILNKNKFSKDIIYGCGIFTVAWSLVVSPSLI